MRDAFPPTSREEEVADDRVQEAEADILVSDLESRLGRFPGATGIVLTRAAMRRVLRFSGEAEFIRYVDELSQMLAAEKDLMLAEALRGFDSRLQ